LGGLHPSRAWAEGDSPLQATTAPAVQTQWGLVRGLDSGSSYIYLGVPFAAPPLASLRWKAPIDPAPWSGELLTQAYPPKCPQKDSNGFVTGSEDCLYLNVWTPSDAIPSGSLPVMVFLHGGGNSSGSTSDGDGTNYLYDGQLLSQLGHVLVVNVQYRLGALGFLVHPGFAEENTWHMAGNYGLQDQIKALEWVQDNIANFGGDPGNVLLFGQSAGGLDTCMLMTSPQASGLFQRALIESGGCVASTMDQRISEGLQFTDTVGCSFDPDPVACLRALPVSTLVTAVNTDSFVNGIVHLPFGPTIDGLLIPHEPMSALNSGEYNHIPFTIGANADETLPFINSQLTQAQYQLAVHTFLDPYGTGYANQALSLYQVGTGAGKYTTPHKAFTAVTTDAQFVCPARRIARAVAEAQTENVYRYFFTQKLGFPFNVNPNYNGAFHGLELAFVFQRLGVATGYTPSAGDLALQSAMGGYWTRFAASGDPNGAGAVIWPLYAPSTDPYLELNSTLIAGQGVRTAKCDFWDTLPTYRSYLPAVFH
jgi:para-nitrobenzyl esterase